MGSKSAIFRFYAELNDFLPRARRFADCAYEFDVAPSVKDALESFGVPHTEVDLVLVDGESVDFARRLTDGARVAVFPMFESFDITPSLRVRPEPLRDPRFVVDANLGALARYLRLLGFDARYDADLDDAALAEVSRSERRALLTRDRELLKRRAVTHGYFVRATEARAQVVEVLRRFDLGSALQPFTRCATCNGVLEDVAKAEIADALPEETAGAFEEFRRCMSCGQVYWEGAHHTRLARFVAEVAALATGAPQPRRG